MTDAQAVSDGYPLSPDPTFSDRQWLHQLSSHAIFTPLRSPDGTQAGLSNDDQVAGTHTRLMTVRSTDLIAVVDNQVRIASLVDAKALATNPPFSPSSSSSSTALAYKTLVPAPGKSIDFTIRSLHINPTGKLLACVGDSQIVLFVIPRTGYTKHVDREIVCQTTPIGPYYHSKHSDAIVSKVDWHPWGENGTSLLVLTQDGLLREYDVAKDAEEPQQTASFLRTHNSPTGQHSQSPSATRTLSSRSADQSTRTFGLSAEDDDAATAVSFSLCVSSPASPRSNTFVDSFEDAFENTASHSAHHFDWSPLTVFGLMKNGDVWALCPFLPKTASVPAAYIHNLAKLASYRAQVFKAQDTSHVDMQLRYVNALLKQASKGSSIDTREDRLRQGSLTPGSERYARSRSTSTMDMDQVVSSPGASRPQEEVDVEVQDGPVRLHPPSWSYRQDIAQGGSAKKAPKPQGPFLLKPAPVELCDERESVACDLVWTWLTDESVNAEPSDAVTGVAALSILGHDGRVDVALLFESVEAAWDAKTSARPTAPRRSKPPRTNRYGLSDTEDEADELEALTLEDPEELPSLLMYETIDLGLLDTAVENGVASQSAASDLCLRHRIAHKPCFVRDPLYGDTLYVYHAFGAQCLGFATWAPKLIKALNLPSQDELGIDAGENVTRTGGESREQALVKMLHSGDNTEVVWVVNTVAPASGESLEVNPVTAVCILSDVYLSYAFLAVTADLQLVGVELSLRVEQDALDPLATRDESVTLGGTNSGEGSKQYVSLLGDGTPFQPPAIFSSSSGVQGLPQHPRRSALAGASTRSELEITPELLRTLGKTVETYRHEIRDVVSAGNTVQARLDLQVREMRRQLEKLNAIRLRCDALGSKGTLSERVQKIANAQLQLVTRIDKALQRLMDSHQPSLSVYETKWFEELERIATEVGVSRDDAGHIKVDTRTNKKALAAKAELLSHQLSLLRPQMDALREQGRLPAGAQDGMLGGEQLKRMEQLLSSEAALLAEAKDKVKQLNKRIGQVKPANNARFGGGGGGYDGDSSISFSNVSAGFGGAGRLPTSSTAANLADFSFASRSSMFRTHSRTGSSFA